MKKSKKAALMLAVMGAVSPTGVMNNPNGNIAEAADTGLVIYKDGDIWRTNGSLLKLEKITGEFPTTIKQNVTVDMSAIATNAANKAKTEVINAASADATTKANNAKAQTVSAAAADATSKANAAENNAKKYTDDVTNGKTNRSLDNLDDKGKKGHQ